MITITGIKDIDERIMIFFDISYNNQIYKWHDFFKGSLDDASVYLQYMLPKYKAYIDEKEALWNEMPKTKLVDAPMGEGQIEVSISKDEIVCPPPDYASLRKREYPPIADYVDGVVKGDQAQINKYIADCLAVKQKYPKNYV